MISTFIAAAASVAMAAGSYHVGLNHPDVIEYVWGSDAYIYHVQPVAQECISEEVCTPLADSVDRDESVVHPNGAKFGKKKKKNKKPPVQECETVTTCSIPQEEILTVGVKDNDYLDSSHTTYGSGMHAYEDAINYQIDGVLFNYQTPNEMRTCRFTLTKGANVLKTKIVAYCNHTGLDYRCYMD